MRSRIALFLACLALFAGGRAHAQYSARAEIRGSLRAPTNEDATAATTVVTPREDPRALVTTEELLLEVPGARPRQLGTLGAFSGLSVRGADTDHTLVMLGEIPLGTTDGSAFDISTLPLAALRRIEVWRGGSPVWLGGGAIGGVLRAVPEDPNQSRAGAQFGFGSFSLVNASGYASVAMRNGGRLFSTAGVRHSLGNFPYVDDRGTRFDSSDDVTRMRANAEATDVHGLSRLVLRVGGGDFEALYWGFDRSAGVPGPAVAPTQYARRTQARHLVGAAWTRRFGDQNRPARFQSVLSFTTERARFSDRYGEVGVGLRDTDDWTHRLFARLAYEHTLADFFALTLVGSYQLEAFSPNDDFARIPNAQSMRHIAGAAAEGRFFGTVSDMRWEIRPSVRADVSSASLGDLRADFLGTTRSSTRFVPNARVGFALEVLPEMSIVASGYTGSRLPTVLELFGDRGYLTGDAGLLPERSYGVDGGLFARGRANWIRGTAEARAFFSDIHDQIVYTRSSQYTSTPLNLARSRIVGVEAGGEAWFLDRVGVRTAITWMSTKQDERSLPLRPGIQMYARLEGRPPDLGNVKHVRIYADVLHVGSNYADVANLIVVPSRTQLGAGIGFAAVNDKVRLDASIRDLLDARGVDVLGFPLPGRTFAMTLSIDSEL